MTARINILSAGLITLLAFEHSFVETARAGMQAECPKPTFEVTVLLCGSNVCQSGPLVHRMSTVDQLPAGKKTYTTSLEIDEAAGRKIAAGFILPSDVPKLFPAGYLRVKLVPVGDPGRILITGIALSVNQKQLPIRLCLFASSHA